MAYGLPTRGQPDWDDELNASMEALRADVQSALSNSNSAQSNANSAKNTADSALATANSAGNAATHATDAANSASSAALYANGAQSSAAAAQAAQSAAEAAQTAAEAVGTSNDTIIAGRINDSTSATATTLAGMFLSHAGNGSSDDTTRLNGLLAAGGYVKGKPGQTYTISAPLVIPSNTTLDMHGCKVQWKSGVTGDNLVRNAGATPQRSVTDAATTAASTTLTSASAAFTSTDVGRSITVFYGTGSAQQAFTANVSSVTNGTTVVLDTAAPTTGSALSANIHNRNQNVRIVGGTWDRGNAVGTTGLSLCTIVVHFADDFRIDVENILSTQTGAKYAVWLAACTQGEVSIHDMDVISDGLHINGPAAKIAVPILAGKTGDDMCALVGQDYPSYQSSGGSISDVHVTTMLPKGSLAGYKILAGNGYRIDNFKASFTAGTTNSYAAWIGADQNYAATQAGSYGHIDLGDLGVAASGELVKIVDCDADKIVVQATGTSGTGIKVKVMQGTTNVGGTVQQLVLREGRAKSGQTLLATAHSSVTVKKVQIDRAVTEGTGLLFNCVAGTVNDLVAEGSMLTYTGSLGPVYGSAGTVDQLSLVDCKIDTSASTGVRAAIQSNGTVFSRINVTRGTVTGAGSSGGAVAYNPAQAQPLVLTLDNCRLIGMKRVVDTISGGITAYLTHPVIDSTLEPFHVAAGGATVIGSMGALTTATRILTDTSVGTLRVNGTTIPVNAGVLTPQEGDVCKNISASSTAGWYVGPVVWDSTASISKWTPLRGYVTVGTATLVAGTVTVSDTKITTNSRILLYIHTPMANMGAPFVSGKTAGTGFTITSSNAADTSVIRYEIITY